MKDSLQRQALQPVSALHRMVLITPKCGASTIQLNHLFDSCLLSKTCSVLSRTCSIGRFESESPNKKIELCLSSNMTCFGVWTLTRFIFLIWQVTNNATREERVRVNPSECDLWRKTSNCDRAFEQIRPTVKKSVLLGCSVSVFRSTRMKEKQVSFEYMWAGYPNTYWFWLFTYPFRSHWVSQFCLTCKRRLKYYGYFQNL